MQDLLSWPTCLGLPGLAWTCLAQLSIACSAGFAVVAYLPRLADANAKVIRNTATTMTEPLQGPTLSSIRASFHAQRRSHLGWSSIRENARSIHADTMSLVARLSRSGSREVPVYNDCFDA